MQFPDLAAGLRCRADPARELAGRVEHAPGKPLSPEDDLHFSPRTGEIGSGLEPAIAKFTHPQRRRWLAGLVLVEHQPTATDRSGCPRTG